MILKVTIAIVVLYYILLTIWLNKMQKSTNTDNSIISKKALSIIGKSNYVMNITSTIENQTQKQEIDLHPMQVDFEMEYDDEEEDPLIDLELEEMGLVSTEIFKSAQGLSFEEMSQAIDIIQQENKSLDDEEERQTVQTISKMQQTELLDIMIEQIKGGRNRVEKMLDNYELHLSYNNSKDETSEELNGFDLRKYLD